MGRVLGKESSKQNLERERRGQFMSFEAHKLATSLPLRVLYLLKKMLRTMIHHKTVT